jgi:hypothetical protein
MSFCTGMGIGFHLLPRALIRGWWISIGPSSFAVKPPFFVEIHMYLCFALGGSPPHCIEHNFQRRMSRLEQRWRAQRSVISIVNCRIPWTNRDLNVYCAFGISLKACLLQCLLIFMPLMHSKVLGAVMCACLCVKEPCAFDASSAQVLSTTSNLINTSVSYVALLLVTCLLQLDSFWSHSRHEVRLANPLNLSI